MEIFYTNSEQFDTRGLSKREIELELGRLVVDFAAKNYYGVSDREIIVENKKPRFKASRPHFSISHSKNIVLAAFYDYPVGADVEFLKKRDFAAILKYLKAEHVGADVESFYAFWTAYEAKIKLQESEASVATLKLLPGFILSVVSNQLSDIKSRLKIYELTSPSASTNPSELINLKLVRDNKKNENALVAHEINSASLEFLTPLKRNIE